MASNWLLTLCKIWFHCLSSAMPWSPWKYVLTLYSSHKNAPRPLDYCTTFSFIHLIQNCWIYHILTEQNKANTKGGSLQIIFHLLTHVASGYRTRITLNSLWENIFNCLLHFQRAWALTELLIVLLFSLGYFLKLYFIPNTVQPKNCFLFLVYTFKERC